VHSKPRSYGFLASTARAAGATSAACGRNSGIIVLVSSKVSGLRPTPDGLDLTEQVDDGADVVMPGDHDLFRQEATALGVEGIRLPRFGPDLDRRPGDGAMQALNVERRDPVCVVAHAAPSRLEGR
jgi:hypothetical protein